VKGLGRDDALRLLDALAARGVCCGVRVNARADGLTDWYITPSRRIGAVCQLDMGKVIEVTERLGMRVLYSPGSGFEIFVPGQDRA
jgi:hypothetical protein